MSHPWRASVAALLLGVAIGSIVFAPARWWAVAAPALTQGRIQLWHPQGSLWRGRADLRLRGDGGELTLPGGIAWRIGFAVEPSPAVVLDLHLPCCAAQPWHWRWGHSDEGWRLESAVHHSTWDLGWLRALGSPWNTLALEGTLRWEVGPVRWTLDQPSRVQGEWRADVLELSSAVSTVRPLGSYRLQGTLAGPAGPALTLATLSGDLRLEGRGGWRGGRFWFDGLAQAAPERLDALSNLLNLLGRRDGARAHLRLG